MLEYEILLFGLLGVLSSVSVAFFATDKNIKTAVLLAFQGVITGWFSALFWIALTGGLEVTYFAMVIPIIISAGVSYIILYYAPGNMLDRRPVSNRATVLSAFILFLLVFFIAFSATPVAYNSSVNTQQYSISALDWCPCETTVTDVATVYPSYSIPMTITTSATSIRGIDFSEKPSVGRYLDFKIYFKPDTFWNQPYLKIGVFEDVDNDGLLSEGDVLWSDADYKVATGYSPWRANCLWENGNPTYGVSSVDGEMLPIFHANSITNVLDETGKTLVNTPEGFIPQTDMVSWDSTGIRDQIINYARVSPGETTSIQGRIYCNPDKVGNNYILVRAYDAQTSNPFSEAPPIQEEILQFEVTPQVEPISLAGLTMSGGMIILLSIIGLSLLVVIGGTIKGGGKW